VTDERDEVRARIDIAELVGREVALKRAGKVYKGLCPFHQDRNPSFTVSAETGRYKCWSCGETGDIFTWVMKRQNVEFGEALRILAKQAGVTLANRSSTPPSVKQAQEAAMDEALRFFRDQLTRSSTAKEYCDGRGLDQSALDGWEIGYAPDVGEALAVHLKKKGFSLGECKNLFLVDQDAGGGYFDKFRGRLIFPIRDERGELVAFGGRVLGQGHPKYINSSDTPLYRKSRVLYGMNRARERLSAQHQAVLVEGYLDVIACHRAGVTNALASLGTSLSEDHAKLLKRWCSEVVILYDSDDAGQKAAERAVKILSAENLRVSVALMPPGDDPDTLLRRVGPAAVQKAVAGGLSPMEYGVQALLQRLSPNQPEFWGEAVTLLAEAPTEMELDRQIVRLAPMYPGLKDSVQAQNALRREVAKMRPNVRTNGNRDRSSRPRSDASPAAPQLAGAEIVVFHAFLEPQFRPRAWMFARTRDLFVTDAGTRLSEAIATAFPQAAPQGPTSEWLHRIEPEELRQLLSDLTLDLRASRLSDEYVTDAVQKLREMAGDRRLREVREQATGSDEEYQYFLKLKERKPDALAKPKEEDGLF